MSRTVDYVENIVFDIQTDRIVVLEFSVQLFNLAIQKGTLAIVQLTNADSLVVETVVIGNGEVKFMSIRIGNNVSKTVS